MRSGVVDRPWYRPAMGLEEHISGVFRLDSSPAAPSYRGACPAMGNDAGLAAVLPAVHIRRLVFGSTGSRSNDP
jgi:hypothetical protein